MKIKFAISINGYTFATKIKPMSDKQEMIVVKPRKKNRGLKKKLKAMAEKSTSPSLNNYLETELLKLVNK